MEGRAAAWTLFGVVVGFKAWAIFLILLMQPTREAAVFMVAMHWPFLLLFVLLLIPPGIWWYRMLRARAKRRRLQWEEWNVRDSAEPARRSPR